MDGCLVQTMELWLDWLLVAELVRLKETMMVWSSVIEMAHWLDSEKEQTSVRLTDTMSD